MGNDDESRKLILRLQMEDLASIWTSSAADGAAALDTDVSLRLYRQELRTAEQQIEDEHSAQAAAQDEIRQRDAILADREAARHLFTELNPNETLPELAGDGQLALTEPSTSGNTSLRTEPSPPPDLSCLSETPDVRPSSSLFLQHSPLASAGVKRSASHPDTVDEPPSKRQAVEGTGATAIPDGPAQALAFSTSTSAGHKRPAEENDSVAPPTKRHKPSSPPKNPPFVWGMTQPAAGIQWTTAVSDPARPSMEAASPGVNWGKSSVVTTNSLRAGRPRGGRYGSSSRFQWASRADRRRDRTASTTNSEDFEPQKLPASRQPAVPDKSPAIELDRSPEVECIVCCNEVPRAESYDSSCGHSYCSKCINRLFKKAVHDDSLWPPQCCKAKMPIEDVQHLLRKDLIPSVKARQVEMSVPVPDRTYCRHCSAFIPEEQIQETDAICPVCWESTCTECNEVSHVGDCDDRLEQDIEDLEALAEKQGWKRCSTCLMFVEHRFGCNHMT